MIECAQNLNQEIFDFLEGTEDEDTAKCKPSKRIRRDSKNKTMEEAGKKPKKVVEPWKSNVGYSIEVEQYSPPAMVETDAVSVLVIPYHPGVNVKFFNISSQKFYSDFVSLAFHCCWSHLFVGVFYLMRRNEFTENVNVPCIDEQIMNIR